jgi:hypothetical protein
MSRAKTVGRVDGLVDEGDTSSLERTDIRIAMYNIRAVGGMVGWKLCYVQ